MRIYKLPEIVLSIKGNASAFLNGIASNTLEAPLNAFLNQHGRIISTFRQQKINDDEFLISVPTVAVDNLLKHLERYVKLSHVNISPSDKSAYIDIDTSQIVWTSEHQNNSISDEEFKLFRLNHNIPLMGVDYQADEFILNVHENDYVSYTKGCFLGQEPVAKVHNRAQPSRKLIVEIDPQTNRPKGFVFVSNKSP